MQITPLSKEQLLDPATAAELLAQVPKIIEGIRGRDARNFAVQVENHLHLEDRYRKGEIISPVEEQYRQAARVLRFVGLPFTYNDQEILTLFETGLVDALKTNDLDIQERLRQKLLDFPITVRDGFKEKIRKALHDNKERLTQRYLILESKETLGTIGNWLSDYIFTVGGGTVDRLKRVEYLTNSQNIKRLDESEQKLVRRLVDLYEAIKISSLTPQGVEEFIGVYDPDQKKYFYINEDGLAEEIEGLPLPPTSPSSTISSPETAAVRTRFKFSSIELLAQSENKLSAMEDRVRLEAQGRIQDVTKIFNENIFPFPGAPFDRVLALGSIIVLAKEELLLRILEESNPVREQFVKYLREEGRPEEAQAFALAPTAPLSLGKFLRFVLQRRMRMPESDAAQIAVRIGNILKQAGKPEYWDMAYFDQAGGMFKWK